jgi:hypothetical protein
MQSRKSKILSFNDTDVEKNKYLKVLFDCWNLDTQEDHKEFANADFWKITRTWNDCESLNNL